MRVKNEAAFIGEALESILPLCDQVLVLDDHSEDDTAAIRRSSGKRVEVLASPFQGLDESRDKNFLLGELERFGPDWVLWIDGDEVLERTGPQRLREAVRRDGNASAFSLRVAYVWDDPEQVRVDGIFGPFRRPSLFRRAGQSASRHLASIPGARHAPGPPRIVPWKVSPTGPSCFR